MSDDSQSRENQTSAHECNYKHLHPAALDALADIVDRLRRGNASGCFAAQDDWIEALNFPAPVPLLHDPAQAADDNKAADRFSAALDTLHLADIALSAIQEHIRLQKETCERRLISLRARGGFSSLPDDVLSIVLEHAYEGENGIVSVSMKLSHVCHRFRQLALRIPTLWSRIWYRMDINLVSLLWDRIKKPVAKITFYAVSSAGDVVPFIRCTAARSKLWSEVYHVFTPDVTLTKDILDVMARETHELHAPFLSFLYIDGSRSTLQLPPSENSLHYYSTWSMPRLAKFLVENFIPTPLTSATSLKEFQLSLKYKQVEDSSATRSGEILSSLILFLESCHALKIIKMAIWSLPEFTGLSTINSADLPSVEALELCFSDCRGSPLEIFFRNARFPNVSTMELCVYATANDTLVQEGLDAVLRDTHNLDRLDNLTLTTSRTEQNAPLQFPFLSLSRLKHLTFSSPMARYDDVFPEGPCLPALKTLTFENCDDLDKDSAEMLLDRLKAQGNSLDVREIWKQYR
ncbi:hypothetical protein SCHPADRAFT_932128 [Schizopora paradoxa]|uniref:Uncharacterized protein n=1 Tax=Schizopora paradoxa TaxID=27342 RepID=A0A0H2R902_9AGAM|nr:hypothetical protein SCHPADRAFT_932128 [Schizopora paradoxa]